MQNDEARTMTNDKLITNDEVGSCGVIRHLLIRKPLVIRPLSFVIVS